MFSRGVNSLSGVAEELGEPRDLIAHHVRELERAGLIEAVEAEDGEEGDEVLYQTNMRVMYTDQWSRLSLEEREKVSIQIGLLIKTEVERSFQAGLFDRRVDRALMRAPGQVDEQGWRELSELHTAMINEILEIQGRSAVRLERSGGEAINARSILALFELPPT